MKSKENKRWLKIKDEGYQAAKNMKTTDDNPYMDIGNRNAWLVGWRNGGGNIMTGKVDK